MTRTAGSTPYIGSVAGCNFGNPIQTGRVRVRPKPDLTQPVDSPTSGGRGGANCRDGEVVARAKEVAVAVGDAEERQAGGVC